MTIRYTASSPPRKNSAAKKIPQHKEGPHRPSSLAPEKKSRSKKSKEAVVQTRLTVELLERFAERCRKENESVSSMVRKLITEFTG
jgi:hypothetical protein